MSLDLEAIYKLLDEWWDKDMEPAINDIEADQLIGNIRPMADEIANLRATLAKVDSWSKFMIGFVDASDPSAIGLSSEHSVGEQLVKFRRGIEKAKGAETR